MPCKTLAPTFKDRRAQPVESGVRSTGIAAEAGADGIVTVPGIAIPREWRAYNGPKAGRSRALEPSPPERSLGEGI